MNEYFWQQWSEIHKRNQAEGYPHLNIFRYVVDYFPKYRTSLLRAASAMHSSNFAKVEVDRFIAAYKLPCLEVRTHRVLLRLEYLHAQKKTGYWRRFYSGTFTARKNRQQKELALAVLRSQSKRKRKVDTEVSAQCGIPGFAKGFQSTDS